MIGFKIENNSKKYNYNNNNNNNNNNDNNNNNNNIVYLYALSWCRMSLERLFQPVEWLIRICWKRGKQSKMKRVLTLKWTISMQ